MIRLLDALKKALPKNLGIITAECSPFTPTSARKILTRVAETNPHILYDR